MVLGTTRRAAAALPLQPADAFVVLPNTHPPLHKKSASAHNTNTQTTTDYTWSTKGRRAAGAYMGRDAAMNVCDPDAVNRGKLKPRNPQEGNVQSSTCLQLTYESRSPKPSAAVVACGNIIGSGNTVAAASLRLGRRRISRKMHTSHVTRHTSHVTESNLLSMTTQSQFRKNRPPTPNSFYQPSLVVTRIRVNLVGILVY